MQISTAWETNNTYEWQLLFRHWSYFYNAVYRWKKSGLIRDIRSSHLHIFTSSRRGHPTTVFCKISVRSSKYCLEFSITWGRLKISWRPLHSCTIFEAQLINSLRFSEVEFFTFHSPGYPIFRRKEERKIVGFKNVMERGIRKILSFVIR